MPLVAVCVLYGCSGTDSNDRTGDADTLATVQPPGWQPGSPPSDTVSPTQTSTSPQADAFIAAAVTVIDFLRGNAGFSALSLSDTVTFHLAPQGGGGRARAAVADLRDRGAWRVGSDGGHSYSLVPPAGVSHLTTRYGRHVRCFDYDLADEFPELAVLPHVGTRLEPDDMTSCLQTWNLTLVFEAGTMPPKLGAVVYDQWEW